MDGNNNEQKPPEEKDEKEKGSGSTAKGILAGLGAAIGITAIGIGGKMLYDKFSKEKKEKKEKRYNDDTDQVLQKLKKQKDIKPKIIQDEYDKNYIRANSIINEDDEDLTKLKNSFICPISNIMMEDPVITPYGTTYERIAILNWIYSNKNDYLTKKPLSEDMLVTNYMLKSAMKEYNDSLKN